MLVYKSNLKQNHSYLATLVFVVVGKVSMVLSSKGGTIMTANQLTYWKNRETERHNMSTEAQAQRDLAEAMRHNLATEKQDAERVQQGWANVNIGWANAASNARNADSNARNAATNEYKAQISYLDFLSEDRYRDRTATVGERNAAVNEQNAATNARNADINALNAAINQQNADTNRLRANTAVREENRMQGREALTRAELISKSSLNSAQAGKAQTEADVATKRMALDTNKWDTEKDLTEARTKEARVRAFTDLGGFGLNIFSNVSNTLLKGASFITSLMG